MLQHAFVPQFLSVADAITTVPHRTATATARMRNYFFTSSADRRRIFIKNAADGGAFDAHNQYLTHGTVAFVFRRFRNIHGGPKLAPTI